MLNKVLIFFALMGLAKSNGIAAPELKCDTAYLKAVFVYFEDMHILIFLDFTMENILDNFVCTNGNNFRPLMSRRDPKTPSLLNITKSSINPHPKHYGTGLVGNSQLMLEAHFPRLYNFNPRTKILCLLQENDDQTIKHVLKTGFEKFKFIDTAALVKMEIFNKTSGKNVTISKFCVYDPFNGVLFCTNFTEANVENSMIKAIAFFKSRSKNLKGYPVKVHIFEYPMLSKAIYNRNHTISHYEYIDGEIVQIMAKYLNFTPVYIEANQVYKHGYQLPNGIFTGSLAAAEYWQADLIANHRVKMDYNTTTALFLDPVNFGRFYFLIPNPPTTKEVLISMFLSVDFSTRILFVIFWLLFPILLYVISNIEAYFYNSSGKISFQEAVMVIVGITSVLSVKAPLYRSSRLIFASVLFYSIIGSSLIHSLITQNMNTKIVRNDIKTLDQLLDRGYDISVDPELRIMFKNSDGNRMARRLRDIALNTTTSEISDKRQSKVKGQSAVLVPDLLIDTYLNKHYDKETKVALYKKVPEIAFQAYESMMIPKRSPIQMAFNSVIKIIAQTGITKYQLNLANIENEKIMIQRLKDGDTAIPDSVVINLKDLSTLFYCYLLANGFAVLIFGLELFAARISRRKI